MEPAQFLDFIRKNLLLEEELIIRIGLSLAVIIGIFLLRWLVTLLVNRKVADMKRRFVTRKVMHYISYVVIVLILAKLWLKGLSNLSTFLGLISAGMAIALRDYIADLAGWMYIIWRRPFNIGDRVQIGDKRGDVIDIALLKFSVIEIGDWVDAEQSTGRIIRIPNKLVNSEYIINYTKNFNYVWNEIPVLITFESNWQQAKEELRAIIDKHCKDELPIIERELHQAGKEILIIFKKITPIVWVSTRTSGILLTIRYLVRPRSKRSTEHAIWMDILNSFGAHDDIHFAYQTFRIYQAGESTQGPFLFSRQPVVPPNRREHRE